MLEFIFKRFTFNENIYPGDTIKSLYLLDILRFLRTRETHYIAIDSKILF